MLKWLNHKKKEILGLMGGTIGSLGLTLSTLGTRLMDYSNDYKPKERYVTSYFFHNDDKIESEYKMTAKIICWDEVTYWREITESEKNLVEIINGEPVIDFRGNKK